MQRIAAIAVNTFREAVRDRVLYGVFAFAIGILLFTLALAELSLGQRERVVMDLGLASISLFGVVIAVFLGSSLLYKEIEKKTLYVILPKPIHRWEFLVGKFGGIVVTALVFVATMGAVQLGVAAFQAGAALWLVAALAFLTSGSLATLVLLRKDATALVIPWAMLSFVLSLLVGMQAGVETNIVLIALLLSLCEIMVLAAVAIFFSSFSTPFLTGLFTVGVWLVGRSGDEMAAMKSTIVPDSIKGMLRLLVEVVPNFHLFVPGRNTFTSGELGGPWWYAATSAGYAAAYTAALLLLAAWVFRRRDFL